MEEVYRRQGGWKLGEGGGSYLCGFLPMGADDNDMPGDRMPSSSA